MSDRTLRPTEVSVLNAWIGAVWFPFDKAHSASHARKYVDRSTEKCQLSGLEALRVAYLEQSLSE